MREAPSLGGVSVPRGDGNTVVRLRRGASISDFADKIDANPGNLVTVLFHLGEMATATESLDEATFEVLGEELGYKIQIVSPEDEDRELLEGFDIDLDGELDDETDEDLEIRPPVVTVMGHVDHGKTRLLDAIRNANVVAGEAGGITQHIGAYQVWTEHEGIERAITFIDTPGHEAFTAMRARGAQVTDIAILVVAADDGIMPQTIEALNHAQAANVPIVVAVNKIDKADANPAKVRQQLTEFGLVAEEYGGDVMFVDVSARNDIGIEDLLDAVLLTADAGLDLRANPEQGRPRCRDRGEARQGPRCGRDRAHPVGNAARRRRDRRGHGLRPRPCDGRRERRRRRSRPPRRVRSRCRASPASRAPATPSSSPRRTAPPVRSPRSVKPPSATPSWPRPASASRSRTSPVLSRRARSSRSTSSSRVTCPVPSRRSRSRC